MDGEGRGIYALIVGQGDGGRALAGDNGLYRIPHEGLEVVVGPAPPRDLTSLPRPELLRHLASYQAVLGKLMAHPALLPARFGTWVADDEEAVAVLRAGGPQLRRALAEVAGMIEMNLAATWKDLDGVFRAIGAEERVRRFKEKMGAGPPEQNREERIELGKLVKDSLDARRAHLRDGILSSLAPFSAERKVCDVTDDSVIVNVALLIRREKEAEFEGAIDGLDSRHRGAIHFRCVGPLPPCSFRALEVRRISDGEIDAAREVLQLPDGASLAQVKAAHRRLARQFHPDRCGRAQGAQERFRAITEAYQLLRSCHQFSPPVPPGATGRGALFVKVLGLAG